MCLFVCFESISLFVSYLESIVYLRDYSMNSIIDRSIDLDNLQIQWSDVGAGGVGGVRLVDLGILVTSDS